MPVASCPSCRQTFEYLGTAPGAIIACVCGHAFDPTRTIPVGVSVSQRQPHQPPPRPRSVIVSVPNFPETRSNLNLFLALFAGASVVIFVVFLLIIKSQRNAKVELATQPKTGGGLPRQIEPKPKPTVAEAPPQTKPVAEPQEAQPPIPPPSPAVVTMPPPSDDPYEQLELRLKKKLANIVFSNRATGAPGRTISSGPSKTAVVLASNQPDKTEAFLKKELKKGQATYNWREFVFIGDKPFIDSIKATLASDDGK